MEAAKRVNESIGGVKEHKIVEIDLRAFGGSALTDDIEVPKDREIDDSIPSTYVPARNTIFLSYALGYAEVIGANDIFIGTHCEDYSGYPDCRPEFIEQFERLANLATAEGVNGKGFKIHAPVLHMDKSQIIEIGLKNGVDYSLTMSCYDPNEEGISCGRCDACQLRIKAFERLGMQDPVRFVA